MSKLMLIVAMLLSSGLLLAGCSANGRPEAAAARGEQSVPATQAVTCIKCRVTWVKYPVTAGGGKDHRVIGYRTRQSMECPDCRSAVSNFFTTGKLEHTCSTCGESLEVCEVH